MTQPDSDLWNELKILPLHTSWVTGQSSNLPLEFCIINLRIIHFQRWKCLSNFEGSPHKTFLRRLMMVFSYTERKWMFTTLLWVIWCITAALQHVFTCYRLIRCLHLLTHSILIYEISKTGNILPTSSCWCWSTQSGYMETRLKFSSLGCSLLDNELLCGLSQYNFLQD